MLYHNVLNLIGNTPLLKMNKYQNNLFLKIEKNNITGSIKDRFAKELIESLVFEKKIKENDVIVCTTSGNLGISLAMIGIAYKLQVVIVMPKNVSSERKKLIKALKGKLVEVDNIDYQELEIIGRKLTNKLQGIYINQFSNEFNIKAGYKLGKEINKEIKGIDYIICGIGSGGTYQGLTNFFRNTKTKVYGVLPINDNHKITGIGPGFIPNNIVDKDNLIYIDEETSYEIQNAFIKEEGLLIGKSSGAVLNGCNWLIKEKNLKDENIVLIFADSKERYLSE